jgi:hypothetical protein
LFPDRPVHRFGHSEKVRRAFRAGTVLRAECPPLPESPSSRFS